MATIADTPFEKWTFTEDELYSAGIFTAEQTAYLKTEYTRAAELKLALAYADYPEITLYLLAQEYHKGFMEAFAYLLNNQHALMDQYRAKLVAKSQQS